MVTFSLLVVKIISKSIGFRPLMIQIYCAQMQTLQRKQEMKIVNLTWLIFPY